MIQVHHLGVLCPNFEGQLGIKQYQIVKFNRSIAQLLGYVS